MLFLSIIDSMYNLGKPPRVVWAFENQLFIPQNFKIIGQTGVKEGLKEHELNAPFKFSDL